MNKFGSFFKPLMWFMALLLAAFVAGCGGGGSGGSLPVSDTSKGAVCTGGGTVACVNLATAGDFAILAQSSISSVPTSPVTGNVALQAGASITGLTCAEVSGKIFDSDAGYPDASCRTTDGPRLTQALTDIGLAFTDAATRPGGTSVSGTITTAGCAGAVPGIYTFTGPATITQDCTLTGTATDVWIFQVPGNFAVTGGNLILSGALPQNVFWRVTGTVTMGAGRQFAGIVMADSTVALQSGASVNGRLYSATDVTLIANPITRP